MNNVSLKLASFTVIFLLSLVVAGQNMSAYAAYSNPPTFGGGKVLKYNDGLVINGNVFDISKFSQKMTTPQILTLGKSSTITLKIFDNDGPTTVKSVTLYVNVRGSHSLISSGDTSIQYPMKNHAVSLNDPHRLLGTVTADYVIAKPFVYVTFHIVPIDNMDTSNLIVSAMDDHRGITNSLIIDAIKFS